MIMLKPGTTDAVFTLNEKFGFFSPSVYTYTDLFFYFRFENELNYSVIDFSKTSLLDLGDGTRYNKFAISSTFSATASAGTNETWDRTYDIHLFGENNDLGSGWNYTIWACQGPVPLSGTISLPSMTQSTPPVIVETGRVRFTEQ
jgi:hypothetical protein